MSGTPAGGGGGSQGAGTGTNTKALPRDAAVMFALLKEMGVTHHEPRVLNQMLEFVYRYVTTVVEEARVYSAYTKKRTIDLEDVKLAIKILTDKSYTTVPPREMLLDLAKTKNSTPLPLLKSSSGLRLPPDRYCLTQPNYQLQFYKRAVAGVSTPTTNRGPSSIFKTPSNPPRPSIFSGSPSEPDAKKQKLSQ